MKYLVKLYKYDPRFCACQEEIVFLNFDPERASTHIDESYFGRLKYALKNLDIGGD